ncbi:alpha-D-ribose 1-methylphosphonate 5-triphosphate diphosphatase [Salinarimonas ramus]|uniref:Alpha-D-ribose 1-methylphosphonate 5-triphosphate diphosphatase n=1 Tax=Salinarimonas ramus TaxID=690164 RepID=A0A917QCT2_9HYPH|nr:alpha-D-ribose 1-methylphosphonate 5-triphosphate diphosphatase [Salinarimonas ramus]GGK44136.1 alpha-D-ribose 1-methylphosphonate 5-triphosphate diphosphatase [Salinarimonas ramus]
MLITGGRALVADALEAVALSIDGVRIARIGDAGAAVGPALDATGLLVLPGLVDIHGDAFERQVMPRPGVGFPFDLAFLETDRQLAANGITTACHGVTWSWEPGLRDAHNARAALAAIEALGRSGARVDHRLHLRHETFNLDAEAEILDWIATRRITCLAFNDHMEGTLKARHRPDKIGRMVERSGLSEADFLALADRVHARKAEVPASIARLARAAQAAGVPTLSHDDRSPEERAGFRAMGVAIAEFPINVETAAAAREADDPIVFGAPNVVRGGSHTGCPSASEMVRDGMCDILASDYYYPAMLQAIATLVHAGDAPLARAVSLATSGPAAALGFADRGRLAEGLRADVILVDLGSGTRPADVVATISRGRLVHLSDGTRLR